MKERPWMPLWIADYLKDTTHLGALESGAYLHLIMHYWQAGKLPTDDRQLARVAKLTDREWKKSKATLQAFFHDGWKHKRIDKELAHAAEVSIKRAAATAAREAAKAAREAEQARINSGSNDAPNDTSNDTSNDLSDDDTLHTTQRKKQDSANAAQPKRYAFENGIIRLADKDFNKWREAFSHLDLKAELIALTGWAEQQGPKRWFNAVANALNKKNREVRERKDRAQGEPAFKWNGIEGVI